MSLRRIAASPTALWVLAHGGLGGRDGNAPGPGQGPEVSRHGGPRGSGSHGLSQRESGSLGCAQEPTGHGGILMSRERGSLLEPF